MRSRKQPGRLNAGFLAGLMLVAAGCSSGPIDSAELLFSPQDACTQRIVRECRQARQRIDAAVYVFTSRQIAQALVEAHTRGVKVRVCLDGTDPRALYSKRVFLEQHGIPVRLISGEGIMHHKFCVIDGQLVITGSFNWTASAEMRNDENLIILRAAHLTRGFHDEFERLWQGRKVDAYTAQEESGSGKRPLAGSVTSVFFKDIKTGYVANSRSKRLHLPWCRWAKTIAPASRVEFDRREDALAQGYTPCSSCKP